MANIFVWLLAAAWPIAKKVLLMLGIGWVTYEGLGLIATQVQNEIITIWGTMPANTLKMASLMGIPQAIGIVLGALAARVAFVAVGKLGKVTT